MSRIGPQLAWSVFSGAVSSSGRSLPGHATGRGVEGWLGGSLTPRNPWLEGD